MPPHGPCIGLSARPQLWLCLKPAMLRGGHPERRGDRDEQYADAGGAEGSQPGAHRAHYPLHLFRRGHLLLARNVIRSERFWPVLSLCYKGLRSLLAAKFRDYCQEHVEHFAEFCGHACSQRARYFIFQRRSTSQHFQLLYTRALMQR